jgi:cytosine/adenosine deaminase-related metal-dependent hydrolase
VATPVSDLRTGGLRFGLRIPSYAPPDLGLQPLGILRVMSWVASLGGVAPETAVAMATGNIAALHSLPIGVIEAGRPADLAVATAIIDGVWRFTKSRKTPPTTRPVAFHE